MAIVASSNFNSSVLGYKAVTDRIIQMEIDAKQVMIILIQVHAPTNEAHAEDLNASYQDLEDTIPTIPRREVYRRPILTIGDFAKIGLTTFCDHNRSTVGPHGIGERNDRTERLLDFAINNLLTIGDTVFKHHPWHR